MTGKTRSANTSDSSIVAIVKEVLNSKDFLDAVKRIIQEVVSTTIAENLKKTNEKIDDLVLENAQLKSDLKSLKSEAEKTGQYFRRNNLRIFGVEEVQGEKVEEKVVSILESKLGINLPTSAIERCQRLGKKNPQSSKPRGILVNFYNYRDRKLIFNSKSKLKSTGYIIKEDLTPLRYQMFRMAGKEFNPKSVWSINGDIFIHFNDKNYKFDDFDELQSFINSKNQIA